MDTTAELREAYEKQCAATPKAPGIDAFGRAIDALSNARFLATSGYEDEALAALDEAEAAMREATSASGVWGGLAARLMKQIALDSKALKARGIGPVRGPIPAKR